MTDLDREGTENLAAGTFALTTEECRHALLKLSAATDDNFGKCPTDVNWGDVADADKVLFHLRLAAFAAGVGPDPDIIAD